MIFKKQYGRLGNLTKYRWRHHLNSNRGLFKRHEHPGNVRGPTITDEGETIGDQMSVESAVFGRVASDDQMGFHEELLRNNEEAAHEYMLVITGALEVWKKDILVIKYALKYLKREEAALHKKEKRLEEANEDVLSQLPEVLQRRFPGLFHLDAVKKIDVGEEVRGIKALEKDIMKHEETLEKYLEKLKKRLPFLFD